MGCIFSQSMLSGVKCILCNETGIIKNELVKHLKQVHQINTNLNFMVASTFLLDKIVSNFEENIKVTGYIDIDIEDINHAVQIYTPNEMLHINSETNTDIGKKYQFNYYNIKKEHYDGRNHQLYNSDKRHKLGTNDENKNFNGESGHFSFSENNFDLINDSNKVMYQNEKDKTENLNIFKLKIIQNTLVEVESTDIVVEDNNELSKVKGQNDPNLITNSTNADKSNMIHSDSLLHKANMSKYTNILSLKCEECDKVLKSRDSLNCHRARYHAKSYNFSCHECSKLFSLKGLLNRHMENNHSKVFFNCEFCSKIFRTRKSYTRHRQSHTRVNLKECNFCDKQFTQSMDIKSHERTHTGEKPYTCEVCGKSFTQSTHLSRHRNIHTNTYRYSCNGCAKKFIQKTNFKMHEKKCITLGSTTGVV